MLIEKLITRAAKKQNSANLRFIPGTSLKVPPPKDDTGRLLYMHVPFCEELCPYCSFNRIVFQEELARPYFKALRKEIRQYAELGYDFQAVYVGGGTPTVLPDELGQCLSLARELFNVKEVSVETNPNHLTPENLDRLVDMGIDRLSVGVQTFDDALLREVQRYHKYGSGEEIVRRLTLAQGRFRTLNADMMFNFPTQTMEVLERDLETILKLGVDQVTYYPLMISNSTRELMKRKMGDVSYRQEKDFYSRITGMLLPRYRPATAWCFSRDSGLIDEYVVNYEEYAGLGSGSIGYLGGSAYANTFDVADYIRKMGTGSFPVAARKDFSLREQLRYDLIMKLFGLSLDLDLLDRKFGVNSLKYLWPEISFFTMVGGLRNEDRVLRLTPKGQYYWVIMMREFFIGVNNFRDYCREEATGADRDAHLVTGPSA
ncbi:MAG: coproporphyrinogen III oxidase family protein [Proteobacteria bacterium]|nr:coproporphyrinogen III oxidase family protein [Pseudomonadota bacterium]